MSWIELERRWHDTGVTNCGLCGRLVPRRLWIADVAGQQVGFCSLECEQVYRDYWLPKYGMSHSETNTDRRPVDA